MLIFLSMLEDEDDQRQFLKLHGAYEKKMYRIAKSILHSHALAEEAVQQSWLQIIEHFEKIKQLPWDKTEGYVVIVVKNVSLTQLKKERHADPFPENWDVPAAEMSDLDEKDRIIQIIRLMPEKYRRILEMKFVLEYSYKDIAKIMNLKESTVATHIARGRKLLIAKLKDEGYYEERSI